VFRNEGKHYPVNAYQSFLLATAGVTQVLGLAAESQRPLSALRAVEICCGGGAAALALRAAGVGVVDASDLNPHAVEACQANARANGLTLGECGVRNCLGDTPFRLDNYDLIVCNPPCRPAWAAASREQVLEDDWLEIAVNGGERGDHFTLSVIDAAMRALSAKGAFVLIVTSTQDFMAIFDRLNALGRQWWVGMASPVAQPYVPLASQIAGELTRLHDERKIIAWDGGDGWFWRLSWAIVVENSEVALREPSTLRGNPAFRNFGYEVHARSFQKAARHFEIVFGSKPDD
jgi:release factor glutamine methyltransferase